MNFDNDEMNKIRFSWVFFNTNRKLKIENSGALYCRKYRTMFLFKFTFLFNYSNMFISFNEIL